MQFCYKNENFDDANVYNNNDSSNILLYLLSYNRYSQYIISPCSDSTDILIILITPLIKITISIIPKRVLIIMAMSRLLI